jgi:hypothetical protein
MTYGAVESALMRARTAVRARVEICLETTAVAASRVARSLRAVPNEVPAASVLAIGGVLATVLATTPAAPMGEPVAAAVRRQVTTTYVARPVVTPAPPPRVEPAARLVATVPGSDATSPIAPPTSLLVHGGPSEPYRQWSGMTTVEELQYCLGHLTTHLCPPDPSPSPTPGGHP